MPYFKEAKGDTLYFAESADGERTAHWLGLKPVSAPRVPPGTTFTDIGSGLARLDVPREDTTHG